jgi:hypothetical protein
MNPIKSKTLVVSSILLLLMGLGAASISAIFTSQGVDAQMSSSNMNASMMGSGSSSQNQSMGMVSNMMTMAKTPVLNITTSAPPITPTMFKSMASKMHVNLINATMIAEKWVGNNSDAVSSMVGIQNGLPVYTIWVIDSNSGLHQILVDPENGKVLFAYQPMSMTGPFS